MLPPNAREHLNPDRANIILDASPTQAYCCRVIQSSYKGIEIEMEMHQLTHGFWKCDFTLIKHPERTKTLHHGDQEFPTMDLAKEFALQEAHYAIDHPQ